MFLSETVLFTLALIISGSLLFLLVYYIMTLSDLECDYLNAVECCTKLNTWVPIKLWAHLILTIVFIMHSHWILTIISLPALTALLIENFRVPPGNLGVFDPTEILNRDRLGRHLRDVLVYLGYYLIIFFVYLNCLIISLLKDDPLEKHFEDKIVTEL